MKKRANIPFFTNNMHVVLRINMFDVCRIIGLQSCCGRIDSSGWLNPSLEPVGCRWRLCLRGYSARLGSRAADAALMALAVRWGQICGR